MSADIVLVTPGLERNSTGRTYSLWLLCRALGLETLVLDLNRPTDIWRPLATSEFVDDCRRYDVNRSAAAAREARRILGAARYVVAVKAMPESFGRAIAMTPDRTRLIVDMDDPDSEVKTLWLPEADRRRMRRRPRYHLIRGLWHAALTLPRMVSNPVLREMYGGSIIPHVREDTRASISDVEAHPFGQVNVAFIGTARVHKGIDVLRSAVAQLAAENFTLTVTDQPPPDPQPWEQWVGQTSLEEGIALLDRSNIVAIPSLPTSYARAQFPVKIVDALLAAKPIVASDFEPLPWAVGDGGVLVPPDDAGALAEALRKVSTPELQTRIGSAGRAHALANYTADAVTPAFRSVLAAVDQRRTA